MISQNLFRAVRQANEAAYRKKRIPLTSIPRLSLAQAGTLQRANAYFRGRLARSRKYRSRNIRTAGFLGVEKKFYDTSFTDAAISAATDATGAEMDPTAGQGALSVPAQGDTASSRDGKKILMKYLEIKGQITMGNQSAQSAADPGVSAFLAIVLDTQTNGAQLNSEDVFSNTGAQATTNATPLRNLLFGPRFKVLKSDTFIFDTPNMAGTAGAFLQPGRVQTFSWYIPLKNIPVNFNAGTTASVANVIDNSLHVIAYCNVAIVTLSYNARLRFIG